MLNLNSHSFKCKRKDLFNNTTEPGQSGFSIAPETLDSVYMTFTTSKFIMPVMNSKILFVSEVNQAVGKIGAATIISYTACI